MSAFRAGLFLYLLSIALFSNIAISGQLAQLTEQQTEIKKVSIQLYGDSKLGDFYSTGYLNGYEMNRAWEFLDRNKEKTYSTEDPLAIRRLLKLIKQNNHTELGVEPPQLLYVNTKITFELVSGTKRYLLLGKYYMGAPDVSAQLDSARTSNSLSISKKIYGDIQQWILSYAQLDKDEIFDGFKKNCLAYFHKEIKRIENSHESQKRVAFKLGREFTPSKYTAQKLKDYRERLPICYDKSGSGFLKTLENARRFVLRSYFKKEPGQSCKHSKYLGGDGFLCELGWEPNLNHWVNQKQDEGN